MREITLENLEEFKPKDAEYKKRRDATAARIGVLSQEDLKPFREEVLRWEQDSRIGLERTETNILALLLAEESQNTRFAENKFIAREHGGNGAEHPIFIGHKIDAVREAAGFGHKNFRIDEQHLAAARLSQKLHAMGALHDTGEIADISLSEFVKLGKGKKKEPDEEALVAPFKIRMAAHAICIGNPREYIEVINRLKKEIDAAKSTLFEEAMAKKERGEEGVSDWYVDSLGAVMGEAIRRFEAEYQLETFFQHPFANDKQKPLKEKYAPAVNSLLALFEQSQKLKPDQGELLDDEGKLRMFESKMMNLFDKLEGDAHFRHFIGMPLDEHAAKSRKLVDRLFNVGDHGDQTITFMMAGSPQVLSSILYSQKTIPDVLNAAEELPDGPAKEMAQQFARHAAAEILRNHATILQKAPPFIEMTSDTPNTPEKDLQARVADRRKRRPHVAQVGQDGTPPPTDVAERQRQFLEDRQAVQEGLHGLWVAEHPNGRSETKKIDVAMDTQTLIAILEKTACAIEAGWTPTADQLKGVSIAGTELPPEMQIASKREVIELSKPYPLEAVRRFGGLEGPDGEVVAVGGKR